METTVYGAIILGVEVLIVLIMLGGFVVSRYGPQTVRDRAANLYYHHIVHRG